MAGAELPPVIESRREDEKLQDLLLQNSRLLLALGEPGSSVPQVAETLKLDVRAVQRKLRKINDAAVELAGDSGRSLINFQRGRNGITLTHHGIEMVKDLKPIMRDLQGAVARYARRSQYVEIMVTSACLGMFERLTKHEDLRLTGISLLPLHRRTSDIHADIRHQRDQGTITPLAFYSVAEEEREPERVPGGPVMHRRGEVQRIAHQLKSPPFQVRKEVRFSGSSRGAEARTLLPLQVDEFKLLAPKELARSLDLRGDDPEVDIEELLEQKWILLAPRYGAVAQFLDKTVPGYWRHGEVRDCTDFLTGIQSLQRDLIPRTKLGQGGQVMVVHGLDKPRSESLQRQGFRLFPIKPDPRRRPIWALTGLFRHETLINAAEDSDRLRWDAIWQIATENVWPTQEVEAPRRSA